MKYNHFLLTLAFFMSFTMLGAIWVGVMSLTNTGSGASIVTLMLALPVAATLAFLVKLSRKVGRTFSAATAKCEKMSSRGI